MGVQPGNHHRWGDVQLGQEQSGSARERETVNRGGEKTKVRTSVIQGKGVKLFNVIVVRSLYQV